jgi:hypothetical protein
VGGVIIFDIEREREGEREREREREKKKSDFLVGLRIGSGVKESKQQLKVNAARGGIS